MSVRRSTEDVNAAVDAEQICTICNAAIVDRTSITQTICKHVFHKPCINDYVRSKTSCPICGVQIVKDSAPTASGSSRKPPTQIVTRSSSKAKSFDAGRATDLVSTDQARVAAGIPTSVSSVDENLLKDIVATALAEQQTVIMTNLSGQISKMIENSLEASLSRLSLAYSTRNMTGPSTSNRNPSMQTVDDVEQRTFEQLLGLPPTNDSRHNVSTGADFYQAGSALNRSHNGGSNTFSDLVFRPDKVSQIMLNWRLKFTGNSSSLSVDKFIYRVEALTKQTLNGNFAVLCGNAGALFEGKANDWFWRFHESCPNFQWRDLCRSLRQQYQDSRTDIDIREMIRDRKQKVNETFDSFYESVLELVDRLAEPLSDRTLVEILRRNLLPDIQHEILNLSVDSVSQLRGICRRREFFLQDMRRKLNVGVVVGKTVPFSKRVFEVEHSEGPESEVLECQPNVSAINSACWNCRVSGHRYQDCVADRTIFCYGCGAPETYKPHCEKCNSQPKNFQASAPQGAPKARNH